MNYFNNLDFTNFILSCNDYSNIVLNYKELPNLENQFRFLKLFSYLKNNKIKKRNQK